jgi:hypothetical protein
VIDNGLDFVLFFPINDVRWRSGVHGTVNWVLFDSGKEGGVKYGVHVPRGRETQLKCDRIDNALHLEGSVALRGQFN